MTGVPEQVPFWQTSPVVHRFESLHGVPFAAVGVEHAPVLGLHVPATKHSPAGAHVTGGPPTQVPLWQVSLVEQRLPSLQPVPLASAGLEQTPVLGEHVPTPWH